MSFWRSRNNFLRRNHKHVFPLTFLGYTEKRNVILLTYSDIIRIWMNKNMVISNFRQLQPLPLLFFSLYRHLLKEKENMFGAPSRAGVPASIFSPVSFPYIYKVYYPTLLQALQSTDEKSSSQAWANMRRLRRHKNAYCSSKLSSKREFCLRGCQVSQEAGLSDGRCAHLDRLGSSPLLHCAPCDCLLAALSW